MGWSYRVTSSFKRTYVSMPRYHYSFSELFGMLGRGTPDSPGTDFCLDCIIDAPSGNEAIEWGYHVLGDFVRSRDQYTDTPHDGSPIREGAIVADTNVDKFIRRRSNCAQCSIGKYPVWIEPWKNDSASGCRAASEPE